MHGNIYYGQPTTLDEQVTWLNALFRTPGMFQALLRERRQFRRSRFCPIPVLEYDGVHAHRRRPGRSSCPACTTRPTPISSVMRHVLSLPASVWFLSGPEHDLAHKLGPGHAATTAWWVRGWTSHSGTRPRSSARSTASTSRSSCTLAGAKPTRAGPGWWTFSPPPRPGSSLVSAGAGHPDVPPRLRGRVIDVGYLTVEQRNSALDAALAYVQPSLMESYSRTSMESWLAGPARVLVRRGSAVVEWHCSRCDGGLAFATSLELGKHLARFEANPKAANQMGERGRITSWRTTSGRRCSTAMERDIMTFAKRAASNGRAAVGGETGTAGPRRRPPVSGPAGSRSLRGHDLPRWGRASCPVREHQRVRVLGFGGVDAGPAPPHLTRCRVPLPLQLSACGQCPGQQAGDAGPDAAVGAVAGAVPQRLGHQEATARCGPWSGSGCARTLPVPRAGARRRAGGTPVLDGSASGRTTTRCPASCARQHQSTSS